MNKYLEFSSRNHRRSDRPQAERSWLFEAAIGSNLLPIAGESSQMGQLVGYMARRIS